jgi:two-component system response regulator VicR
LTLPKRILVVDDEPDTVELIHLTLSTAGYQIDSAMSAFEARRKLEDDHYDVLLLDVMMPEVSGFDLLTQLNESGVAVPPVIFLTARQTQQDRETGEDLGAVGYLTKPAKRGDLLDSIEKALG